MNKFKTSSVPLEEIDPKLINEFQATVSNTILYTSLKHLNYLKGILSNADFWIVVVENHIGEVIAMAPYSIALGPQGRVFNSLPFYGSNGGVISNCLKGFQLALDFLVEIAEDCEMSTIIENPLSHSLAFFKSSFITERHFHIKDLRGLSSDTLMTSFHYKTRNAVRKSLKNGFKIIRSHDYLPFLIETHRENMEAIGGKAKDEKIFSELLKNMGSSVDIWTCLYNGKPISALLNIRHNNVVEYYTPVIKKEFRSMQPLSYLIYESLLVAIEEKMNWWNWGASWLTQTDLIRFKNRWGSNTGIYRCYTKIKSDELLDLPSETLLNNYPYFYTIPFDKLRSSK